MSVGVEHNNNILSQTKQKRMSTSKNDNEGGKKRDVDGDVDVDGATRHRARREKREHHHKRSRTTTRSTTSLPEFASTIDDFLSTVEPGDIDREKQRKKKEKRLLRRIRPTPIISSSSTSPPPPTTQEIHCYFHHVYPPPDEDDKERTIMLRNYNSLFGTTVMPLLNRFKRMLGIAVNGEDIPSTTTADAAAGGGGGFANMFTIGNLIANNLPFGIGDPLRLARPMQATAGGDNGWIRPVGVGVGVDDDDGETLVGDNDNDDDVLGDGEDELEDNIIALFEWIENWCDDGCMVYWDIANVRKSEPSVLKLCEQYAKGEIKIEEFTNELISKKIINADNLGESAKSELCQIASSWRKDDDEGKKE